ncbi:putative ferric-chelate reductase 1 [Pelodytes ibericus]
MEPFLQNIVILSNILYALHVDAYSSGLVQSACVDMTPGHNVSVQTSTPPYSLTLSNYTYTPGANISVTLQNMSSGIIEGFLIQARDGSSTVPLGYFEISASDTIVQKLKCIKTGDSVSHTSDVAKSNVQVTWVAPTTHYSNIQIRATVVQNFSIIWKDVVSAKITYSGSASQQLGHRKMGKDILKTIV